MSNEKWTTFDINSFCFRLFFLPHSKIGIAAAVCRWSKVTLMDRNRRRIALDWFIPFQGYPSRVARNHPASWLLEFLPTKIRAAAKQVSFASFSFFKFPFWNRFFRDDIGSSTSIISFRYSPSSSFLLWFDASRNANRQNILVKMEQTQKNHRKTNGTKLLNDVVELEHWHMS